MAASQVAVSAILYATSAIVLMYGHTIGATFQEEKWKAAANNPGDPHGGVPMGVPNDICDNGEDNLEVDWDPHSSDEYKCLRPRAYEAQSGLHFFHCDEEAKQPIHMCMNHPINYTEDLPTSGMHRPLWPVYGEYSYVPPQRWLHSLEHGGIVFLYHPCADKRQIKQFKSLARSCLRRHVIAAYKKLPPEMNFAVLAWRCKLILSDIDVPLITKFVKARAKHGPEQVATDGQYRAGLIHQADVVTTLKDKDICPYLSVVGDSVQQVRKESEQRQREYKQSQKRLQSKVDDILQQFRQFGYQV